MGSWVTYGLGSENENLPGFVVLISSGVQPSGGQSCWGTGFLPSVFQGVQCRSKGDPVLFANDPPGMTRDLRRATLDVWGVIPTPEDVKRFVADRYGVSTLPRTVEIQSHSSWALLTVADRHTKRTPAGAWTMTSSHTGPR